MDGCIISIRHLCIYLLTYLLTHLLGGIKPAISPKRLKIERKLHINGLYKVVHWFSILPPKCMTLNDLLSRFKVIIP